MHISRQPMITRVIIAGFLISALCGVGSGADTTQPEEKSVLVVAPPPPGSTNRAAEFAVRNSPENIRRLVDELAGLVAIGWHSNAVAELEGYRNMFIERLVLPPAGHPLGFSLDMGHHFFTPLEPGNSIRLSLSTPDELTNNIVTFSVKDSSGQNVRLQMKRGNVPGCFNWTWAPEGYWGSNFPAVVSRLFEYGNFFDALLGQYLQTTNKAYLDKWAELIDDRYLNYNNERQAAGMKAFCEFSYDLEWLESQLIPKLAYLARKVPGFARDFPAPTLARILIHDLHTQAPICIRAARQETGNRNVGMRAGGLWYLTRLVPEYREAGYCLREFRRQVEFWPTITMYPDGVTPGEETLSYYVTWPGCAFELWNTMRRVDQPEWATPVWGQELEEKLSLKAKNWLHEIYNHGGSFYYGPGTWSNYLVPKGGGPWRYLFPAEAMADPEIQRIRSTVFGDGSYGTPTFTSECFPYGEHYLLRSGWSKKDDIIAFMLNNPGAHQADVLGLELWAYGETMLKCVWRQPVKPDGMAQLFVETNLEPYYPQRQNEYFELVKDTYLNIRPRPNRWHSSDAFAFCESTYAGPYVNRPYPNPPSPAWKAAEKNPLAFITDIKHQRQILMLSRPKALIVTDRLTSEKPHKYRVEWALPNSTNVNLTVKDNAARTAAPDKPNLSIYHFRHEPVTAALEPDTYLAPEEQLPGCTFEGAGKQVLVTLLYPRRTITDEVKKIESLPGTEEGVCGFEATLADGSRILCQAAPVPGRLQAADVTAMAEQLVLMVDAEGERHGIALGCSEFKIGRKKADLPGADFEFALPAAKSSPVAFTPIYRPLGLVRILPQVDCFVDELQVTLAPPAPDLDIRYTTDLSDPDCNSPLYREPLKVQYTTTLKARAFRKGVTKVPPTFDNTLVSAVSRAQFTKLPYQKAAVIKEGTVVTNGLTANYYEGDWKLSAMFLNPYSPFKQGPVPELFDLSLRRPVTNNYAFIYTGYLDIPQEGVYNFYAPVEMYCPKFDAGYDLRVFLDNEEWYPGTRLHNLGVWSVPLERGKHQLRVIYADMRPGQAQWQYPYAEFEAFQVWRGEKPVLEISGPGLEKQPLPAKMLFH